VIGRVPRDPAQSLLFCPKPWLWDLMTTSALSGSKGCLALTDCLPVLHLGRIKFSDHFFRIAGALAPGLVPEHLRILKSKPLVGNNTSYH
jgi:hypothetical protein